MSSLLGVCLVSLVLFEALQSSALDSKCYFGLGLESGSITNDQITASANTSSPTSGRLNHDHGAWCFRSSDSIDEVFFSVDLGQVRLISGFQSQGPPQSKHGVEYLRYVGLRVALSLDGSSWRDCCGDLFYADDKSDSQGVISTHSFHRVETARYIRILASSGVRWVGHEEKCFRFEVLGCSLDDLSRRFQPEIHLMFNALPAGFLDIQWTKPEVEVANRERVFLESERFLAKLVTEEGQRPEITQFNLTTPGFISANPVFGAKYQVEITCVYQGFAINCGRYEKEAVLKAPSSCFLHVSPCSIADRIDFIRPHRFRATSLEDGSVVVKWTETRHGWRSPNMRLKVEDNGGNVIEEIGDSIQKVITLPNLQKTNDYKLVFTPYGPNIPNEVKEHTGTLVLMTKWNSTKDHHHSFVADVDFQSQIQWSGQIRSTWEPARAIMESKKANVYSEFEAQGYIISLRPLGGSEDDILQTANLSYVDNAFSFGGILMGNSYQLSLDCIFQNQVIPCGNTVIASGSPVHFVESNSSMVLYMETSLPDQWGNLESECVSSGGHLVSLDHYYLEEALARNTNLSSYWSGGNICPNSPAPPDSMWSDGSAELSTNFAFNSGLDGGHCCIKVDIVEQPRSNSSSVWKGENCASYLHGICEYKVTDYLDEPVNLVGTAISPESINLTWSGAMKFWQPQEFMVVYCHVKSLSAASLPIRGNFCRYDSVKNQSFTIKSLQPFSEYNVSIIGRLPPFEKMVSAVGNARTLPMSDVEWIITPKGHLIVSWLKKIAKFEESDIVMLSLKHLDGNVSSNYTGTASEVRVTSLQLGGLYEFVLIDPKFETSYGPISIEAYPNCSSGARIGLYCSQVGTSLTSEARADSACQGYPLENQTRSLEPIGLQNGTYDLVWMGKEARHQNRHVNTSSMEEEDTEKESRIRFPDTRSSSGAESCQAWSIAQERLRGYPCEEILPVLCQNEIPFESNAPNRSSLRIIPGPTHVVLSWDAEADQGWQTNYTVRVTPQTVLLDPMDTLGLNDTLNRTGRLENDSNIPLEFNIISSSAPPINLTNLWPESEYSVELITSLGPKFKTTLQLDNIFTTANDSKMPAEIVGYTMVADDYRTAEFSIMSFVMVILLLCIIILVLSGTIPVYADNAMQVCFQISLFLFTLCLLLAGTDGPWSWDPEDQTWCALATGFLALFILTALTFLLLESLCIVHKLVPWVTCPLLDNIPILVAIGFLVPLLYIVIVVPILYTDLMPDQRRVCWLNLSKDASAAILVPISLLFLGTLIILLISFFSGSKERLMSASYHVRSSTLRYTRYVLMLILGLLGLVLGLGLSATHLSSSGLLVTFMVFFLILALVILILRCFLDKQVLLQIKRLRKSNEEIGETYLTRNSARAESRSAYSRKSIASGQSRTKSIVSHNQVAPQRQSITPVESEEDPAENRSPDELIRGPRQIPSNRFGRLSRKSSSSTTTRTTHNSDHLRSSASSWIWPHSVKRPATDSEATTVDCDWQHSKNALWRELENNSPYSASNRKALRRFRRICSEQYTPILLRSHGLHGSVSPSMDAMDPPAKYTSPFGDTDLRPVIPDGQGRLRSAGLKDAYFSLPNTPDTEDPMKGLAIARPFLQLSTEIGGESYI
ncbi:uncharacterized protein LOC131893169 isoform X1 [Tigriopus californicus]|uniref:uncharacterized protein LOC131893169 isoform X1 n=1 Tax=Tigriopus californicus TaxID=6832 RepID=UPI0027DA8FB1|nr:uncharacterized protein LOC131893169 isoform X1 [Tigriopus californicus]XP_059099112.1 uncharacterized protein LOC131893169 isoform X1 [Tigriopus californicus]